MIIDEVITIGLVESSLPSILKTPCNYLIIKLFTFKAPDYFDLSMAFFFVTHCVSFPHRTINDKHTRSISLTFLD